MRLVGILALFLIGCYTTPAGHPAPEDTNCTVIKFSQGGFETCLVECLWTQGYGSGRVGYSSTVPVDCSWYGKKVTRS